jgi:hypothetical protein
MTGAAAAAPTKPVGTGDGTGVGGVDGRGVIVGAGDTGVGAGVIVGLSVGSDVGSGDGGVL